MQKLPSRVIENGQCYINDICSDINSKAGWYYDDIGKLLWIKSSGKITADND
jgi:hypothetical protein